MGVCCVDPAGTDGGDQFDEQIQSLAGKIKSPFSKESGLQALWKTAKYSLYTFGQMFCHMKSTLSEMQSACFLIIVL